MHGNSWNSHLKTRSSSPLRKRRLGWFQHGRLNLDEDFRFSEKIQNSCTYQMTKKENNLPFRFYGFKSQIWRKMHYWLLWEFGKMAENLLNFGF